MSKIIKKYETFLNKGVNEELGWKDALLGVLSLFAMGNVAQANNKLAGNEKLKAEIQNVLNDETQKKEIIDSLNKHGMPKAAQYIQNNADKVLSDINKIGTKEGGGTYTEEKSQSTGFPLLKAQLQSGFAITGIQKKVLRDTIQEVGVPEITYDTISMDIPSDQLFAQGSFKLNNNVISSLTDSLTKMKNDGLVITGVTIESSTDKQRIGNAADALKGGGFDPTNQGLSQARNNAFKTALVSVIGKADIHQVVKAEQGKGTVGAATPQDPSARYVKATFVCVRVNKGKEANPKMTVKETIKYIFTVSKVVKGYDGYKPTLPGVKMGGGSGKATGGDVISCPVLK